MSNVYYLFYSNVNDIVQFEINFHYYYFFSFQQMDFFSSDFPMMLHAPAHRHLRESRRTEKKKMYYVLFYYEAFEYAIRCFASIVWPMCQMPVHVAWFRVIIIIITIMTKARSIESCDVVPSVIQICIYLRVYISYT